MLKRSTEALQRWKGFDQAIDRWLEQRHELIVLLSEFAARQDFDQAGLQLGGKLQTFRSLLIDYVSAGHFEFYRGLIAEGLEFDDHQAVELGSRLMASIEDSTQKALGFDEKYESCATTADLAADLSTLAEALASRFADEDQMISTLHDVHLARKTG